ncbi:putative signal transducing protein [Alteromonas halophila]|uniref:RanBP2-type domain-containing protein n=1 Tax=Alteromonas halophila TaxID=516698 RepID=A0A918JR40_9ALTE|nr:DUF2007 domain-containing protein [Alteromonas halophila]GGW94427.1 hypothetical protein GCM10007391_30930 [Alteromonas halophila]
MKQLFVSAEPFMMQSLRSALDAAGVPYMMKNEYAGGALGELPWQDTQQELWLVDESWGKTAQRVLSHWQAEHDGSTSGDWCCHCCGEENGGAFERCWACGANASPSVV